ncbi:TPA: hypothetical protein DEP58_00910 [Patescibacteria group bacterium]|nr:MAG: hypothetical protein UU98_C0007G0006 [Parcubacteria group bacterium GW2011_GWD2_42_14]HCC04849.1 hypothetical protein [Patescibacteria group bacterium]
MFWLYSKREIKLLLNTTLVLFSAFALLLGQSWSIALQQDSDLTANTVGVYAGVEENGVNTLVAQLDEREKMLDARELALTTSQGSGDRKVLLLITLMGSGLLGLILMNFYLDSKRRKSLVS